MTKSAFSLTPSEPTFDNFWFTEATETEDGDVCKGDQRDFVYINKSSNIDSIGSTLTTQLTSHPNCNWSKPQYIVDFRYPVDYPGNSIGYINNAYNTGISTKDWFTICLNNNNQKFDQSFVPIYPAYTCPPGKKYIKDLKLGINGCYMIDDNLCKGDVVGRDLNVIGVSNLGHIGLLVYPPHFDENHASITPSVLEVLNVDITKESVIQFNSLNTFKKNSANYWGARHSLRNFPALKFSDYSRMVKSLKTNYYIIPAIQ